ncbi:MAG TPA: CidA/LrgA family protein [Ottowia sp.]|uniref:CidA/LrgA family protein n=1 Tax=Ottowia sp. TaxID=1898956 RepID=UPI002CEA65D2|nr:CidA/LrgA family protein [Ottowia sp.]HMN22149.1 CidA/LrgA family protein [Ottowia sp.]
MRPLQGFAWLLVLQLLGEVLERGLGLPFPGPVIGMALLIPALRWPAVRESVADVARFLLGHLSLLFVPVGVGVITHLEVLREHGLRLALVIVLSTWIGLAVTALVLRALLRRAPAAGDADA